MQTRLTHRSRTPLVAGVSTLALALAGFGCMADQQDEADEIAAALELDNGGLETTDEPPMFGDEDLFRGADLGEEAAYDDPMASDTSVTATMDAAGAVVGEVVLVWGQLPPDGSPDPRNWSGRISINRGALLVRRTIAFDPVYDRVLPRTDPRSVEFTSATGPHMDGLLLAVADPDPASAVPLTLTYANPDGVQYSADFASLLAGPVVVDYGDGNRMAGVAMDRPAEDCEHGFLRGRWHQIRPGRGVFLGGVADADGNPIGHVRGIYGRRASGERVFFGKYIDLDGQFRGIFAGHYGEGHFQGHWLTRNGDHGVLGGEYVEDGPDASTDRIGGHFMGRWAEARCELPLDPGPPPDAP